jgi:TRAP-type uncharacterized transport system substrate-binding protein
LVVLSQFKELLLFIKSANKSFETVEELKHLVMAVTNQNYTHEENVAFIQRMLATSNSEYF